MCPHFSCERVVFRRLADVWVRAAVGVVGAVADRVHIGRVVVEDVGIDEFFTRSFCAAVPASAVMP